MIESRIIKQEFVEWRKLRWFQSENFKNLAPDEMEKLKNSIKNNDFIQPFNIWVDDLGIEWILDGHHRQKAMKELEREGFQIAHLLPANFLQCEDRRDAAKLVAIYSAIYAKISRTGLMDFAEEHGLDLSELSLELELPNLNIDALAGSYIEEEPVEDVIPEVNEVDVVTQPGDLYELGSHRLLCGDSKGPDNMLRLMQGDKARVIFTDPPYNLSIKAYVVDKPNGSSRAEKFGEFTEASGEMTPQQFAEFLTVIFKNLIDNSLPGSIHFVCMDWRHIPEMLAAGKLYTEFKQLVVWNKNTGGMGTFYRSKHELVFVFKNGDAPHINNFELGQHGRYRTNVWDYESASSFTTRQSPTEGTMDMHPTVKPVAMVVDSLLDCSNRGDIALDLFGGSGTTLIASEMADRRARLCEFEGKYCDVIVRRYIAHCKEKSKPCVVLRNGETIDINSF